MFERRPKKFCVMHFCTHYEFQDIFRAFGIGSGALNQQYFTSLTWQANFVFIYSYHHQPSYAYQQSGIKHTHLLLV